MGRGGLGRPTGLWHRDFALYFSGVVLSEIGTRGTAAAILFHVYQLTGSSLQVGLVGVVQAVAVLTFSPLGGALADRLDRRRLLQGSQGVSLLVSLALALVTVVGAVEVWHIGIAVLLNTATSAFERPARDALIPSLVPRAALGSAFALLNPSREVAILIGPTLAGLLIAVQGPAAMYALDAATYAVLVVLLALLRNTVPVEAPVRTSGLRSAMAEGLSHVRRRPLVVQLISLDLATTVFGSYRVLLPAFATDVLGVGAAGYGLLSGVPSAGALVGAAVVYRHARGGGSGRLVLRATAVYGMALTLLAIAPLAGDGPDLAVALAAAAILGAADSIATSVRHALIQLTTADALRGRVTALYQVASRGGPALGSVNLGTLATLLTVPAALLIGGAVPMGLALALGVAGTRLAVHRGVTETDAPNDGSGSEED